MTPIQRAEAAQFCVTLWEGCYDSSWRGLITPQSFAHPAKFSRGLIERIFDHCLERGWIRPGDIVGDCFGGIGTGGIIAAYRGLRWIGCELEPRFIGFSNDNFAMHRAGLRALGRALPQIIQGDSRRFHEVVRCAGIVTSPPYASQVHDGNGIDKTKFAEPDRVGRNSQSENDGYGSSSGQIGRLKSGPVDAVLTSPPYAHIAAGAGGLNTKPAQHEGQQSGRNAGPSQTANQRYGDSPGQIAGLPEGQIAAVITSPPFSAPNMQPKIGQGHRENCPDPISQGSTEGNIETLPPGQIAAVVTSPPFEDCTLTKDKKFIAQIERDKRNGSRLQGGNNDGYGQSYGQIGNDKGESYWSAMQKVYASAFQAIKPGGIIVVVVKDYVSKRKRVPLCDDTLKLLVHCGFKPLERIHAMLTQSRVEQDLLLGTVTVKKERKSFFRRLAEKKGSPAIDYEVVLFCKKP